MRDAKSRVAAAGLDAFKVAVSPDTLPMLNNSFYSRQLNATFRSLFVFSTYIPTDQLHRLWADLTPHVSESTQDSLHFCFASSLS